MKNREVTLLRCHQGIQLGNQVVTSVSKEKNKAEMELWPMGIRVQGKDSRGNNYETVITYNMIHQFDLAPETGKTEKK